MRDHISYIHFLFMPTLILLALSHNIILFPTGCHKYLFIVELGSVFLYLIRLSASCRLNYRGLNINGKFDLQMDSIKRIFIHLTHLSIYLFIYLTHLFIYLSIYPSISYLETFDCPLELCQFFGIFYYFSIQWLERLIINLNK